MLVKSVAEGGAEGAEPTAAVSVPEAVSPRVSYILGAATGVLYFLGFAATERIFGFPLWYCSLFALAPIAVAMEGQSARVCLGAGAIAGFTMNMLGFYWLFDMLKRFSGFAGPICLVLMALLCAYQGGRIALFGWLNGRARERGWPKVPVFLLAFAASELLYPLLFPWYFGASVHGVPALTQLAELGGPYIVGLVLAAPNLALAELVLARLARRRFDRTLVFGGIGALALAVIFGFVRIAQVDARVQASEPVRVGIVQGNMPLLQSREDHAESLRRHVQMTEELRGAGADFAVWSESSVMWNIPADDYDRFLQTLFTKRLGIPAVFGALLVDRNSDRFRAYNVALASDAQGKVVGRYDKHYLLAFGEYLPFGETFPVLYDWSPNSGHLTPGTSIDPVPLAGHTATAMVCYEDILPHFVNEEVSHGASSEILLNVTNDAWFGVTTEPWIHLALAEMRAVEHRRYLVRSTNSGVSALVDPVGRVVVHTEVRDVEGKRHRDLPPPERLDAAAHFMKGAKTGYEIWGDVPWWLGSLCILGMAIYSRRERRWRITS